MDKRTASNVIGSLLECQSALDSALAIAETIQDETERAAIVAPIKTAIGEILTEGIMPIASQHPELNPYD